MAPEQMSLDLTADPASCPLGEYVPEVGRTICHKDGKQVYTNCTESQCGEPPRCAWEDPDNSPEARQRRLKWMREHKEETK